MEKFLNVLPIIIMVESFAACIPLFYYGRYGSGLYWLSAGIIGWTITFGVKQFG